jgi:type I restriction enzyme S subunit
MVETAEMLRERIQEEMRIKLGKKYAPSNVDSESLPKLPIGWIWISIEQVALVETGATPLRSNPKYYDEGEIPWVTSGSLNDSFVTEADEFITELAIKETNAKVFPINALLVAMYGEGKTRGKVSELLIEASTNQACAALLFEGKAESIKSYIKIFFEKNYEDIRRLSSGGVQPNLNLSIIKATKIPLPPLKELEIIVKEIENNFTKIGEVILILDQDLKVTGRLRQSILKRAFEGKLVPQNPNDEPAAVLLEQIKAEKSRQDSCEKIKRTREQTTNCQSRLKPLSEFSG